MNGENEAVGRRNAQVIGFMSGKGGVGKTGLSINIANFCASYGVRVLMIDCDFNTHGATMFFSFNSKIGEEINENAEVFNFQNILTELLNEEKLDFHRSKEAKAIPIKENFDFIPAGVKGKVFDDAELTQAVSAKLINRIERYFDEWKKEYDLILLDFCAGFGDINYIFSKFVDKVCIVMKNDEISKKAVKATLSTVFKDKELDEIVCCVNIIRNSSRDNAVYIEALIDTVEGFENSDKYDEYFNKGKMLPIDEIRFREKLCAIVNGIWKNNTAVAECERIKNEEAESDRRYRIEIAERRREEAAIKRNKRILLIRLIAAAVFFVIAVPVIFVPSWHRWIKVLSIIIMVPAIWLILGRGDLYSDFVLFIKCLIDPDYYDEYEDDENKTYISEQDFKRIFYLGGDDD